MSKRISDEIKLLTVKSILNNEAVIDYIYGNSSLTDICIKYKIRSHN